MILSRNCLQHSDGLSGSIYSRPFTLSSRLYAKLSRFRAAYTVIFTWYIGNEKTTCFGAYAAKRFSRGLTTATLVGQTPGIGKLFSLETTLCMIQWRRQHSLAPPSLRPQNHSAQV